MNTKLWKKLIPLALILLAPVAAAAQPHEDPVDLTLAAHLLRTFDLTAAAPAMIDFIAIDDAEQANLLFSSSSRTLMITLTAPGGERFVFGAPNTAAAVSSLFPDPADPAATGAHYLFVLTAPQPGIWKYEVEEPNALSGSEGVVVTLASQSDVRAGILGGDEDYLIDRDVRLGVIATEGTNILHDVTVTARLTDLANPGRTLPAVLFKDDGANGDDAAADGLFTASFQPGTPGQYAVLATVTGTNSQGNPFERTLVANFTVHPVRARLLGTFGDSGVDADGDGLLDSIDVSPAFEILEAGSYNVGVTLTASNGATLSANRVLDLSVGTGEAVVSFAAEDVKDFLKVNGPYQVSLVRLEKLDLDPAAIVDEAYNLGNTGVYTLGQLEREPILILSSSAVGLDTNGNGLFEVLEVKTQVDFRFSGFYNWSARLVDSNGTEIGLASGAGFFPGGPADLTLDFNGPTIGRNGVDGPYQVRDLIVFGSGVSTMVDQVGTTQTFTASQFEGFLDDREPPQLSVQATPSFLSPPDHRMVEIRVNVQVSDNRDPNPVVRLESITSNQGDNAIGDGNTSNDIQVDNGRIFLRAERAGNAGSRVYTLTYSARDRSGNVALATTTVTVAHDQGN